MPVGYTILLLSAKTKQGNQHNEASRLRKCIKKSSALSIRLECEEVSLPIEFTTLPPKNHNLFVKTGTKRELEKKELRPQANNAQYNTPGERGGRGWSEKTVGGGAGGSFTPTYIWAGWNSMTMHINFSILLKRDFYLLRFKSEGQQKPGDVSLMQSDCKWLHWMLL